VKNLLSLNNFILFTKKIIRYILFIPSFFIFSLYIKTVKRNIRFGWLRTSRIGHCTADIDAAIHKLSNESQSNKKLELWLFVDRDICNSYILVLIKRMRIKNLRMKILKSFVSQEYLRFLKKSCLFNQLYVQTVGLSFYYENILDTPAIFKSNIDEQKLINNWISKFISIDSDKPFVFLHNRDSAYLPELNYHGYRDFSVEVFNSIIESYVDELNFFLGGKKSLEAISKKFYNCIDLPFTAHDDVVDILAHEKSLFYFGSDSGIHSVSTVFRKPVGIINFAPCSYDYIRRKNHLKLGFIPKKMINKRTSQPIGLIEMYENNWIDFWSNEQFESAGIMLIDNSPEEVSTFFDEALSIFKSNFDRENILTPEQEEFWRIVTFYQPDSFGAKVVLDNCFISPAFLKRNLYLFSG
jgi:putative glycosyltransferase (TIGR04372 family)